MGSLGILLNKKISTQNIILKNQALIYKKVSSNLQKIPVNV